MAPSWPLTTRGNGLTAKLDDSCTLIALRMKPYATAPWLSSAMRILEFVMQQRLNVDIQVVQHALADRRSEGILIHDAGSKQDAVVIVTYRPTAVLSLQVALRFNIVFSVQKDSGTNAALDIGNGRIADLQSN